MLTRLQVRNFKTLEEIDIPLGQNVVLIGQNNSGKTTALQALALWQTGLQEWAARRGSSSKAEQRTGVTVNRRSLTHTPVADTKLLWHKLRVSQSTGESQKVFLDVIVHGETDGQAWQCGLEFNHANSESVHCRPIRLAPGKNPDRMEVPKHALAVRIAMLPPMSGLASEEPEVQAGRIAVLLGEGRTAEVLRNLSLQVFQNNPTDWCSIQRDIEHIFGVRISEPERNAIRGTIELSFAQNDVELDLASAGRGMQQTLLLLAHLRANAGSVLLLDEPDAHLEILRQRQIYNLLTDTARHTGSQILAASHSEVVLNEAADKDVVIAFVGKPHRIDDRGSQVLKALKDIGFEEYYQAEIKGFVLYVEGATDLAILRGFARVLEHPALGMLDDVFVHYVANQTSKAEQHFYELREAKPDLRGFAVFDRIERGLRPSFQIPCHQWTRREIENYLCSRELLLRYAGGMEPDDLVGQAIREQRREAMETAITEVEGALAVLGQNPWSDDFKVSDQFLPQVFGRFFQKLNADDRLNKTDFHILTDFLDRSDVPDEVTRCLDRLVEVATQA